jgi:hypothetical protein
MKKELLIARLITSLFFGNCKKNKEFNSKQNMNTYHTKNSFSYKRRFIYFLPIKKENILDRYKHTHIRNSMKKNKKILDHIRM